MKYDIQIVFWWYLLITIMDQREYQEKRKETDDQISIHDHDD